MSERGDWCQSITCPHCGAEDGDHCDYPEALKFDGDYADMECATCEKPFTVWMCVETTYSTEKKP